MSSEITLAYTVHHKGRKYRAGLSAEDIGPVAGEFGAHVWEGGKAPAKSAIPREGSPDGGTYSASPEVPRSGLPGPAVPADTTPPVPADTDPAVPADTDPAVPADTTPDGPDGPDEGTGGGDRTPAKKAAPTRRSSTGS